MKMEELEVCMLTVEIIDELTKLVIKEHPHLFVNAVLNVMERHPDIVEKYKNAEVQEEDNAPNGV